MFNQNTYNSTQYNSTEASDPTLYYDYDIAEGEIPIKQVGKPDVDQEEIKLLTKTEKVSQDLKQEDVSQDIDSDTVEML